MATADSLAAISQLGLVQAADDKRSPDGDRMRLPRWLRKQVDDDLAALEESDAATVTSEGERTGRSAAARVELERMEHLLREAYRGIGALRSSVITEAQRREVYATYGWSRGLLGRFPSDRILGLARLGVRDHGNVPKEFRYPADLAEALETALAAYDALEPEASTAVREIKVWDRNLTLKAARQTLSQVRHWYCAASRDTSRTKELSKIGFQPRRKRGAKKAARAGQETGAAAGSSSAGDAPGVAVREGAASLANGDRNVLLSA